jgi:hypothetical protein
MNTTCAKNFTAGVRTAFALMALLSLRLGETPDPATFKISPVRFRHGFRHEKYGRGVRYEAQRRQIPLLRPSLLEHKRHWEANPS